MSLGVVLLPPVPGRELFFGLVLLLVPVSELQLFELLLVLAIAPELLEPLLRPLFEPVLVPKLLEPVL